MGLVAAVAAASAAVLRSAPTTLDAATAVPGAVALFALGAAALPALGAVALPALCAVALPVLGAVGFCTRVPLGTGEPAWRALTDRPWAMVVAAYPLGAALALALVPTLPPATTAVLFPLWLLVLTGITHLDGLADVGDAAVVHGDVERRRDVLLDTTVGVGALVAVGVALVGVALAAHGLATARLGLATSGGDLATGAADASVPLAAALGVVVAAEVGAKLGMVVLAGLGPQLFGTLGSQLERAGGGTALAAAVLAVPAAVGPAILAGRAAGVAATSAVLAGPVAALLVGTWASARLDGVNGDCFGATNEIARLGGLHVGLALLASGVAP